MATPKIESLHRRHLSAFSSGSQFRILCNTFDNPNRFTLTMRYLLVFRYLVTNKEQSAFPKKREYLILLNQLSAWIDTKESSKCFLSGLAWIFRPMTSTKQLKNMKNCVDFYLHNDEKYNQFSLSGEVNHFDAMVNICFISCLAVQDKHP